MGTDEFRRADSGRSPEGAPSRPRLSVEVWSDVVCPWCYIGKRRFEAAIARVADEIDVDVTYRPFQLDPRAAPGRAEPVLDAYTRKFGGPRQAAAVIERVTAEAARDGLSFRLDRALRANTLLAHRLLWWAEQPTCPIEQAALKERLLRAYFVEGLNVGDPDVLADCAADVGADREVAARFIDGDGGRAEVVALLEHAWGEGITAVPTYVVAGRWIIPGAQEVETFTRVLRRLGDELTGEAQAAPPGGMCDDDVCEI